MKKINLIFKLFVLILLFFSGYFYYQIFTPVKNFPVNKNFYIEKGDSTSKILQNLENQGFINSAFFGKILSKIINVNLKNGEYFWDFPASTFQILQGAGAKQNIYKITIPEGYTKLQIAEKIENLNLKNFSKKEFLENGDEGYLFPDTYFLESTNSTEDILKKINDNFEKRILTKFQKIPTKEQIILASILEREARTAEGMKMVAGILENRLKINMPLQVDATVLYGQGVWKARTYFKDLKSDSAYNTYQNTGLPPGPISNPSLNALEAAIFPTKNNYLYYLTGKNGEMHYAKTFEEHVRNRRYLR
jgi:UPF0755 protein